MPKININGLVREMTAEEIAEMQEHMRDMPVPDAEDIDVPKTVKKIVKALKKVGIDLTD